MDKVYVHTLGDSTLDNLFWMLERNSSAEAKKKSVEGILQTKLSSDQYKVISHAFDGFTTQSVLEGDRIGAVLWDGTRKVEYCKEKGAGGSFVKPLEELRGHISNHPNSRHYVVLSVGGNDFRVNLGNPWKLFRDIPEIQNRYLRIVKQLKALPNVHPVLMLQYRTDANGGPYPIYPLLKWVGIAMTTVQILSLTALATSMWIIAKKARYWTGGAILVAGAAGLYLGLKILPLSSTKDILTGKNAGIVTIGALMQTFYQPILTQAKKDGLAILDLPNTFDPHQDLYESGIEPGEKGGRLIAEGIHHVIKHHDFDSKSMLYAKPPRAGAYKASPNEEPSNWHVAYPK